MKALELRVGEVGRQIAFTDVSGEHVDTVIDEVYVNGGEVVLTAAAEGGGQWILALGAQITGIDIDGLPYRNGPADITAGELTGAYIGRDITFTCILGCQHSGELRQLEGRAVNAEITVWTCPPGDMSGDNLSGAELSSSTKVRVDGGSGLFEGH